ncbi:MAG: PQQ-binding-like beta-propeller repeat protein, partial [Verrucomicrobiota bacterium]
MKNSPLLSPPITLPLVLAIALAHPRGGHAEPFDDPYPPKAHRAPGEDPPNPKPTETLTFHKPANPLAADAVTADWPHLLGPNYNLTSVESPLITRFPESGPPLVWEISRGPGFAPPVVKYPFLIHIFRAGANTEAVECLHPETGQQYWRYEYEAIHITNFGIEDSARASPTIDGARAYTLGINSVLHCFELATGHIFWSRDLRAEFATPHNFFGQGASPLVHKELLILNLGGRDNLTVVAFDKISGQTKWAARHSWGASYASPIPASFHNQNRILVFAGGESRPPHGGLLVIDPADGSILSTTPWRADVYASVNAASPVLVGENQAYITEAYTQGGTLLRFNDDDSVDIVWKAPRFGAQFSTPVLFQNHLFGFDGSSSPGATLVCYDAHAGVEKWRAQNLQLGRANLLAASTPGILFCLGEHGEFLTMKPLTTTPKILAQAQLFRAPDTFSPPVLSRGLLYIVQSRPDAKTNTLPRLLCFDLRPPTD